jgi:chromosome segregation ATPase
MFLRFGANPNYLSTQAKTAILDQFRSEFVHLQGWSSMGELLTVLKSRDDHYTLLIREFGNFKSLSEIQASELEGLTQEHRILVGSHESLNCRYEALCARHESLCVKLDQAISESSEFQLSKNSLQLNFAALSAQYEALVLEYSMFKKCNEELIADREKNFAQISFEHGLAHAGLRKRSTELLEAQSELKALHQEHKRACSELHECQKAYGSLEFTCSSQALECARFCEEIDLLQEKVVAAEMVNPILRVQHQSNSPFELDRTLAAMKLHCSSLEAELKDQSDEVALLNEEISDAKQRVSVVCSEKKNLLMSHNQLEAMLKVSRSELVLQTNHNVSLQSRYDSLLQKYNLDANKLLTVIQDKLELRASLANLQNVNVTLQKEFALLQREFELISAQNSQMKIGYEELQLQNHEFQDSFHLLKAELDTKQAKLVQCMVELESLSLQHDQIKAELARVKCADADRNMRLEAVEAMLSQLTHEHATLSCAHIQLVKKYEALNAAHSVKVIEAEELEIFREEHGRIQGLYENESRCLSELSEKYETLVNQLGEATRTHVERESRHENECVSMKLHLQQALESLSQTQQDLAHTQIELQEMNKKYANIDTVHKALLDDYDELAIHFDSTTRDLLEKEKKRDTLNQKFDSISCAARCAQTELEKLRVERDSICNLHKEALLDNESFANKLEMAESLLEAAEAEIAAANIHLAALQDRIHNQQLHERKLESTIDALNKEKETVKLEFDLFRTEVQVSKDAARVHLEDVLRTMAHQQSILEEQVNDLDQKIVCAGARHVKILEDLADITRQRDALLLVKSEKEDLEANIALLTNQYSQVLNEVSAFRKAKEVSVQNAIKDQISPRSPGGQGQRSPWDYSVRPQSHKKLHAVI